MALRLVRRPIFWAMFATLAVLGGSSRAQAQQPFTVQPRYDLFYNYYVGPPGVPAAMYVSPLPTPPFVGHTYITYQPLMPQEFLYWHHRTYRRFDGCAIPVNTTHVRWW